MYPAFDLSSWCCLDECFYGAKGGEIREAERFLIEDVHDAVVDLVELIKTYRSKHKMAQVIMSTLFKRRQEEADAMIERAVSHLHVSVSVRKVVFLPLRSRKSLLSSEAFSKTTTINICPQISVVDTLFVHA